MRRKVLGLAIAAFAAIGPMQAWGGDREIAEQIIERLKDNRESGALKNFSLDMKVDKGVVLFRGKVDAQSQKDLVLKSAAGVAGIESVVDELKIKKVAAPAPTQNEGFSLREALAQRAEQIMNVEDNEPTASVIPSVSDEAAKIQPAAAIELAAPAQPADQRIVDGVVAALGRAQSSGKLKGFGVDVKSNDGVVWLKGQASSEAQRNSILQMVESIPGVRRVRNSIQVPAAAPKIAEAALPSPPVLAQAPRSVPVKTVAAPIRHAAPTPAPTPAPAPLRAPAAMPAPLHNAQPVAHMPARTAAAPMRAQAAPYRMSPQQQSLQAQPVQAMMGAPVMGQPVPMNYGGGIGAPRYDAPNLPNYAWPGYASHPNYAALTYPQQYSPSAWPYIGPFYPYPQVPMGWRKVSLEWDDGWWFLDFTDR